VWLPSRSTRISRGSEDAKVISTVAYG